MVVEGYCGLLTNIFFVILVIFTFICNKKVLQSPNTKGNIFSYHP